MSAPPTAPITTSANSCYSPLRNRSRGLERVDVKFKPRLRSCSSRDPASRTILPGSWPTLCLAVTITSKTNRNKDEPRWLALVATLATALIYSALPSNLSVGPRWLLLAVMVAVVIPTFISHRVGHHTADKTVVPVPDNCEKEGATANPCSAQSPSSTSSGITEWSASISFRRREISNSFCRKTR
jgi:hypothetical protein